jgi:hypothetical protein
MTNLDKSGIRQANVYQLATDPNDLSVKEFIAKL